MALTASLSAATKAGVILTVTGVTLSNPIAVGGLLLATAAGGGLAFGALEGVESVTGRNIGREYLGDDLYTLMGMMSLSGIGNMNMALDPVYDAFMTKPETVVSQPVALNAASKAEALKAVDDLPSNVQSNVKSFFKGGSNKYTDFTVEQMPNGNYMASMTKPGDVPGSKAIYYKEILPNGTTINVVKDTFDPAGNLVHTKPK